MKNKYLDCFSSKEEHFITKENHSYRGLKTKVLIKNKETGEIIFQGRNKTMIAGSEYMAMKMFYLPHETFITPTYNNALNLDNTVNTSTPENTYMTQLFCIGTSGCNKESALVYEVDNKHWIDPDDMIPFRYVPFEHDLTQAEREVYFGRKTFGDRSFYGYYFKKFDSDPTISKQLEDGTPIDSSIYDNNSELTAQVVVTNTMSVTVDDARDWFIETTGINNGRFNCIELCMSWTKVIGGFTFHQDIRPITRINFPNKLLNDLGASWEIVYQIYF